MRKSVVITAAIIATMFVVGALSNYIIMVGAFPSGSQENWGQFGDYFGGLLNPMFAMLAFLALLWSITLQDREFRAAASHLAEQAEVAREELQLLRNDRLRSELLHVVREIDSRIDKALQTEISAPGTIPRLSIGHMVTEAERLVRVGGESSAFSQFIHQGRTPGTMVEAPIREIITLVERLRTFLEQYSRFVSGNQAPLIVYYADKAFRLLDMLEHFDDLPEDTRSFFATVSDPHG